MGDTANWEFAAAVAAVSMGLGGLLLFTLVGVFGGWNVFRQAGRAAAEAQKASLATQELARQLAQRSAHQLPVLDLSEAAGELGDLRAQTDALIQQQGRLQEAIRNLVEAGVLGERGAAQQHEDLERALKRLEENLTRVAAAVGSLGQRPT